MLKFVRPCHPYFQWDSARPPARAELEDLAEEDERGDDGRGLEVQADAAVLLAERGREELRRQRGHRAVEIRRAHADPDEREHVEIPAPERRPHALEERPSTPEDHRRGQAELHEGQEMSRQQPLEKALERHTAHRERCHRDGERQGPPEAAAHVAQLRIVRFLQGHRCGLERHAADGARSRAALADLGVHGTGVDGGRRAGRICGRRCLRRSRRRPLGRDILSRIGTELLDARFGAEVVGLAFVSVAERRRGPLDVHAADRV